MRSISPSRYTPTRIWQLALGGALVAAAPISVAAHPQEAAPIAFVHAVVIDPAEGAPLQDATVVVRDGRIMSVQTGGDVPEDAVVIDLGGRHLVPGLIDTHVHISDLTAARRALRSGVTTARSMGAGFFADVGLRELARSGAMSGPEILAAGYHVRPRPAEGLFLDAPELADLMGVDVRGAAALRRVGRVMLGHGVDFIKVNATERAGLPETDPRVAFYDEGELRALVEEAEAAGVPVAAHAHGDEGGRAAVLAGVRSIEHGTYLSEETLRHMLERGTYLVPTIAVVSDLTLPGGDYDNAVLQIRGRHMLPRVRETAATAHRLGVKIAAATDTGYGSESVLRLSHELLELVGVGLSPLEAIRAASTTAAELLGVGDRVGRVAAGYEADLLVLERNPLEDIGAYQDVLFVMSDGSIAMDRLGFAPAQVHP
jgi:imidazolonepropionase-like amidohydrolase